MVNKHEFKEEYLIDVLKKAESKESILEAISRPAERTLTWNQYRDIFIKKERINAGVDFWVENKDILERIYDKTGVDIEIMLGIIGVETYFGRITGGYRVIDALSTLAFDYPKRSPFFTRELESFLLIVREEEMDPFNATGSYAGAMGSPQFMPSSYRAYAIDSDGDGKRDIWDNWEDVIGSVANYLVVHGWQKGNQIIVPALLAEDSEEIEIKTGLKATESIESLLSKGVIFKTVMNGDHPAELLKLEQENYSDYWVAMHNFFVITKYNHSIMYGLAVHQLGQDIAEQFKNHMSKTLKNLYLVLSCFLLMSCISNFMGDGAPKIFTKSFSRDAVPRSEPLSEYGNGDKRGYYEVRGKRYRVMSSSKGYSETGIASWYGTKFHGRLTSNREIYNIYAMTAAHKSLPLPTYVKVTNIKNKKTVIVR